MPPFSGFSRLSVIDQLVHPFTELLILPIETLPDNMVKKTQKSSCWLAKFKQLGLKVTKVGHMPRFCRFPSLETVCGYVLIVFLPAPNCSAMDLIL